MNKKKLISRIVTVAFLILLVALVPRITNSYTMTVVNTMLIYYIAALSVSIIFGLAGQLALSGGVFMALGGFIAARLVLSYNVDTVAAIFISVIVVSAVSVIFGYALMRLSGVFFCFGTMALMQIGSSIFDNFRPLSGGPDGIYGIPKLAVFGFEFDSLTKWFYLLCGVCLLCAFLVNRIKKTSIGRGLACVRDNNIAANTLGINVYSTKVIVFVISAAFSALAGALLAFHNGTISPSLFTLTTSTNYLLMAIIGGVTSPLGTFFGTALVTMMPEWLRPMKEYLILINGVLIIILMVFMPAGIKGLLDVIKKRVMKLWNRARNKAVKKEEGVK